MDERTAIRQLDKKPMTNDNDRELPEKRSHALYLLRATFLGKTSCRLYTDR